MVTSRWTILENNLFKLAQEEAHPNRALFLHSCFQARGTVSSRNISSRAVRAVCRMVKHSLQVWRLEGWRTWDTCAREKKNPCSLQFTAHDPSLLWRAQPPYGKTIFKSEFTTALQNSMLDATKFMLFLYLLSGSTYIFISEPFDICVVILKKACFSFYIVVTVLYILTQETKNLSKSSINKNPYNTADQIASLRFRKKARLPTKIWKQAYKWFKY